MALVGLTTSGGITAAILPGLFRKKVNDINLETEEKPEGAYEKDAMQEER